MDRPDPSLTPAQSDSIGKYVRAKRLIAENDCARAEQRKKSDENYAKIKAWIVEDTAFWNKWGHWISRVLFFINLTLALSFTAAANAGLLGLDIGSFSRRNSIILNRDAQPLHYWFSTGAYLLFAAIFWRITIDNWRGARWRRCERSGT